METLDNKVRVDGNQPEPSKVVNTALQMVDNFESVRSDKDIAVKNAKDDYDLGTDGKDPTKKYMMPSFILTQLTEIWATFVRVPDIQIKALGLDKLRSTLFSRYLEQIVDEGGFYDLMTTKFGGFRQQALFGDFFVECGYKTQGKTGMPTYRGVSVGNFFTDAKATAIRSKNADVSSTRCGFTTTFGRNEIETIDFFKGVSKKAYPGDLPNNSEFENETGMGTDQQKSEGDADYFQVMYFYDIVHKVFSTIVGSNAYEWNTIKGEDFPYIMEIDGDEKPVLPVAHFGLFAAPEGLYHKGLGEMFHKLVMSQTDLNSGVVNNAVDNRNATGIVNIPSADAADIFQQIKLAGKKKKSTGENTYIVPTNDGTGAPIGRGNIDYLKNETNIEESQAIKQMFDEEIRRFGFNLNAFFNQQDTARQSELDLIAQNQTVSKFQAQNTEAYRFVFEFALDAIKRFGDEKDDTIFGTGITLEVDGEELEADAAGITVGEIVKEMKALNNLKIEIDTSNGFIHNPLLERRSIARLLEVTQPGTPAYTRLLGAMSVLEGQSIDKTEFQGGTEPTSGNPATVGQEESLESLAL